MLEYNPKKSRKAESYVCMMCSYRADSTPSLKRYLK